MHPAPRPTPASTRVATRNSSARKLGLPRGSPSPFYVRALTPREHGARRGCPISFPIFPATVFSTVSFGTNGILPVSVSILREHSVEIPLSDYSYDGSENYLSTNSSSYARRPDFGGQVVERSRYSPLCKIRERLPTMNELKCPCQDDPLCHRSCPLPLSKHGCEPRPSPRPMIGQKAFELSGRKAQTAGGAARTQRRQADPPLASPAFNSHARPCI